MATRKGEGDGAREGKPPGGKASGRESLQKH